jgi:hypothetical protein
VTISEYYVVYAAELLERELAGMALAYARQSVSAPDLVLPWVQE